jgi:hypothetical protein
LALVSFPSSSTRQPAGTVTHKERRNEQGNQKKGEGERQRETKASEKNEANQKKHAAPKNKRNARKVRKAASLRLQLAT